jgi:hypothetical protein
MRSRACFKECAIRPTQSFHLLKPVDGTAREADHQEPAQHPFQEQDEWLRHDAELVRQALANSQAAALRGDASAKPSGRAGQARSRWVLSLDPP